MSSTQLLVKKDTIATAQLATLDDEPLENGQIRLRVERFALTSNNITYAAFGDAMSYWGFYPTAQEGWGIVPVWGFATVVQSLHAGVAVGERLYGYWPMASHAVLSPAKLSERGFVDAAAHRAALHSVYNQYMRCNTDAFYTADSEDVQALMRPLFMTSFLIDDFMADNAFFGTKTMLLSSASSKTAYGTAHCLHKRAGIEVVGLTSEKNRAFCESLGCYSQVLSYEQLGTLAADTPCVYIDFAGSSSLRMQIHSRFSHLAYSCSIGGTHVEDLKGGKGLPGPRATLFFAPAQIKKRAGDWGAEQLGSTLLAAWHDFTGTVKSGGWLQVQQHSGAAGVQAAYAQVLAGAGDPRLGHMLSFGG